MRALFLGSGGRVGRLLKAAWHRFDVLPTWHTRADFDILTDVDALAKAVATCEVIINLAGATHHGDTTVGGANTDLSRRVLECAGNKPVFLLSSAAIYGKPSAALTEDTAPAPISDYGRDKVDMEVMAQAHPARSIILRLGNVAGADALLGVDRERYVLDQFADGSYPSRSYIGPKLLTEVLADLILTHDTLPNILNIATANAVSMDGLLKAAGKPWDDRPAPEHAIPRVELNTDRLEQFVNMPTSSAATIVAEWAHLRHTT